MTAPTSSSTTPETMASTTCAAGRSVPRLSVVVALVIGLVAGVAVAVVAAPALTSVGKHADRWSGENRYETSVAISQARWTSQNTTTVFLATGQNYPDALALGASTGGEGPILLVQPDALPDVVRGEITRLQPCRIVAAGGPAAVADAVVLAAEAATQRQGCPDF